MYQLPRYLQYGELEYTLSCLGPKSYPYLFSVYPFELLIISQIINDYICIVQEHKNYVERLTARSFTSMLLQISSLSVTNPINMVLFPLSFALFVNKIKSIWKCSRIIARCMTLFLCIFVLGRLQPTQSQLIQIYSVEWTDVYDTQHWTQNITS